MIKIQFLGTCAGIPSKMRNVSSLIIQMLHYENECWMIDCGEATQHQLLHSSMTLSKINKIFITHLHGDHIYGLPGLISSRSFQGATGELKLFGPKGIKDFIYTCLSISGTYIRYPLEVIEIDEGVLFSNHAFSFEAIKLEHGLTSFGFRIQEKDTPGSLNVEKLKSLGVTPGPIFKQVKEGKQITLKDGTVINGADFVGPLKKGKVLAIAGDTRQCNNVERLAKNADIFIHEATFLNKDKHLAYEHYHSTAKEVALLAKKSNVKLLFLNHISSRYSENTRDLLQEAEEVFSKTFIPNDLQTYIIKQNNEVTLK